MAVIGWAILVVGTMALYSYEQVNGQAITDAAKGQSALFVLGGLFAMILCSFKAN
jgi:hypothetical protein